jgi:outer membrane receptor protein involved in Fe transport
MTPTLRIASQTAGLALLCAGHAVLAQTTPAAQVAPEVTVKAKPLPPKKEVKPEPPPTETGAEVASVTVSAERPTNRIDRQVYDVKSDVGSSNGTAADALNNVPSVAVDPDGTVSLRGSTNVQILVDGKPSAMLQGDNRGATLNALASDDIESIEVINNPGAQFGNEGGGGPILNLIMRRNRKPGGFASVNANGGTAGRYNSSVSGSYNQGLWGFQGGVNVRHDGRNSNGDTVRDRIDPLTGLATHSTQTSQSAGLNDSAGLNGTVNYNLGAKDTLQASMSYNARSNDARSSDHYVSFDPGMASVSDYVRSTTRGGDSKNYSWGSRMDHKGSIEGELLKLDLRVSGSTNLSNSTYKNIYAVSQNNSPDRRSRQANETGNRIIDFTGDYERPMEQGALKLGFKVADHKNDIDATYLDIDPVTAGETLNPMRTNHFDVDETNLALYGSYQMRLNERWGVLGGLRTEYTDLDMRQVTTGIHARNSYINYIPSLFATYKVSSETNIRLAYAHRLRRPTANDLNPFVIYRDELNVSSGNPQLKPTQTDSYEIGYETRLMGLEANLRGYFRKDTDSILDRKYFINDTVVLTTRDNGPGMQSSGLEFTLSGKLTPKLSLNTSGNLARSEQRILDVTGADNKRTASSLSGRVRLNYQATPDDQLQMALQTQGRTLWGQGYRSPNTTVNFSARHALTPRLNLVLNVTDAFNTNKIETVTDTSMLKETSIRRYDGRVIYLGLSYRIGGVTPAARREGGPRQGPGGQQGQGGPGGAGGGQNGPAGRGA